ncbi:DUF1735 and LamG domain-containing protein [Autumnicola musiva]|uniref:DUF1735 and LamG domain-containing protein n=1 Tax=Autumnicola musiva TaxID=3075589 RepID=A0ABU3D1P0_9FLAO|nr:DUF1735 and LamG domain-containing protein [Zunongwangia sp. F117]MDT0675461.1 DUF1735 and LamG domain-containing protein [Zunongwangia sp. F117]
MKIKYNIKLISAIMLCAVLTILSSCDDFVDFQDVILITGTEENNVLRFAVEEAPATFSITASSTARVTQDVNVNFNVDPDMVPIYNEENNANYEFVPEGSYEISSNSSQILSGTAVSDPVTVTITSTENFVEGRNYIIPVTISGQGRMKVLEASRTVYLRVSRVIDFNAVDISNPDFYDTYQFSEPITGITEFTYEIRCKIDEWHSGQPPISRLSNWGPVDESLPNLLRFGEAGSDVNQLQWVSAEGATFSETRFATDTWYTISCVYDGSDYRLYVNGSLDSRFSGSGQQYVLAALELGMSYGGYEYSQRFLGSVAEIRFWNRALSLNEIQAGLCAVDPSAEGLLAYWKLNEGEGNVFYDNTGNGRDMDWSNEVVWNTDDNQCAQ